MDFYLRIMDMVWEFVRMRFTIYGFTFSMFDVIMLTLIFCVVCYFIDSFM